MTKNLARYSIIALVLLTIVLRGYHVTDRSLWFDEAFSWRLIQFPFTEMIQRDAADVHPPLYYILLQGWAVVFGSSLFSLRSFSIAAAALATVAMYLYTSAAWRSRLAGVVAALLFTVSGWQIAFAWEARMYTLGTVFALLTAWLLLRAVRQKHQYPWWWLAYGIATAAFLYTHYFAVFSIAAQIVFILGTILFSARGRIGEILQSRLTWYAIMSGCIGALLFAPWLPTFLEQNSHVQAQFWIPKIGGWSIPDTFYRMIAPTSLTPPHQGLGIVLAIAPIVIVVLGSIWLIGSCFMASGYPRTKKFLQQCDAAWLTICCSLLPFIFAIGLSLVSQSLYQDRYFVFAHLFLIAGGAGLLVRMKPTWLMSTATAGVAVLFFATFVAYWQELNIQAKPGAHAAVRYVFAHHENSDPVYSSSPFVFFAAAHYAQEEFQNKVTPHLYSETGQLLHFSGGPILTSQDVVGPDIFTNEALRRFWLVETTGFGSSEMTVPAPFVRADHQVFPEIFPYQGDVIVNKYERR